MYTGLKREKNILMTTMSKLNRMDTINYYYSDKTEGGIPLFCDGISSVEDGSKYILSQYPIDEILVVGTSETFSTDDGLVVGNLADYNFWQDIYKEWEEDYLYGTGKKNNHGISAYEFYKLRITEYLNHETAISSGIAFSSVSGQARRDKIEKIALNVVMDIEGNGYICPGDIGKVIAECMLSARKFQNIIKEIQNRIEDDIEQAFQEEEGYLQYISQKKELFSRRIDIAIKNNEYQNLRKDIERDSSLSILEREFLFVSLLRKIDNLYYEKEKIHMEAEAGRLRKENAKLQYQIQNLKKQRAGKELDFAKYVLYQHIESIYKMKPYSDRPEKIAIRFVPEKTEENFDNIAGIINEIYAGEEQPVNLYVDMQGGNRTSGYVRNAILSILNNQDTSHIKIQKIIATDFIPGKPQPSEIVDETKRYRINDLVSGMNAFIRYGKADMLVKYCEDMEEKEDSKVRQLTDKMKEIDDAISLCNIQGLRDGIGALSEIINPGHSVKPKSYVSNIFQIMEDSICRDYGKLLEDTEIDYMDLIDWCQRKGLIQQALTIIEDKMPAVLLEKFIHIDIWKKEGNRKCEVTSKELKGVLKSPNWEKRRANILFYELIKSMRSDFCHKMLEKICQAYFSKIYNLKNADINEEVKKVLNIFWDKNKNNNSIYILIDKLKKYDLKIAGFSDGEDGDELEFKLFKRFINIYLKNYNILMLPDLQRRLGLNYVCGNCVLKQKNKLLDKYNNGEEITDFYCWFREISDICEDDKWVKKLLLNPSIYAGLVLDDKEYCFDIVNGIPLKTLAGLKNQEYIISQKDDIEIIVKVKLPGNLKKMELDKLLLLHEALKSERNNINHASDKGMRLPLKIVKKAVQEYIEIYRSLLVMD